MRKSVKPKDLKPCPHMRTLVSAWMDGKLAGLAKAYTEWHVRHCPQCGASLPFLRGLSERMRHLAEARRERSLELPKERWAEIEAGWDKVDEKTGPTH